MAYMERLGLWGEGTGFSGGTETMNQPREEHETAQSNGFTEFNAEVAGGRAGSHSAAVMEMVALDMKQRGMYLSR